MTTNEHLVRLAERVRCDERLQETPLRIASTEPLVELGQGEVRLVLASADEPVFWHRRVQRTSLPPSWLALRSQRRCLGDAW